MFKLKYVLVNSDLKKALDKIIMKFLKEKFHYDRNRQRNIIADYSAACFT